MEARASGLPTRAVGSVTDVGYDERRKPMRGSMLWFNEVKDLGFILTDEGERISVHGDGFAGGVRPKGRCARMLVSFEVTESDGVPRADNVELVAEESPRRARPRRRSAR
jgi:cold shock CspA family protein